MSWLDASNAKYLSKVEGTVSPPINGESISVWLDRSGNGYHGIPNPSANAPIWKSTELNGNLQYSLITSLKLKTVHWISTRGINCMYLWS